MSEAVSSGPRMSVVISAFSEDRWKDLLAAVESVRRQRVPPYEIVVVIDHNPRLLERARAALSDVAVIENRERLGLSGARNSGVVASCGDVIAFIDDDALAAPDWLERLGAEYTDPAVLGVGGAVEPAWVDGRPAWFPDEFDWVVGCTFRGMPDVPARVSKLVGCNMSFRRDVFTTVGGFRSDMGRLGAIPLAGEETEFCLRAGQRLPLGYWVYEPRARVSHTVPARRAGVRYFRSRCYGEGLSKARIAALVGAGDGLASERAYAGRALPRGVARGIGDAVLRRDPAGLVRVAAIIAGLTITAAGYLSGALACRIRSRTNTGVTVRRSSTQLPRRAPTSGMAAQVVERVEHPSKLDAR